MIIDFRTVFGTGENRVDIDYDLDLSDLEYYGFHPIAKPAKVTGSVTESAGVLRLKVSVSLLYSASCDRCATEVSRQMDFEFSHILVNEISGDDNDELIVLDDMKLDLDELLRTNVILSLPTKFLCRDDCKGICQTCGADLNKGACDCSTEKIDPRLEALKQLL